MHEYDDHYFDNEVHVRLTNDPEGMKPDEFDDLCKDLSGEVTTYFVEVK